MPPSVTLPLIFLDAVAFGGVRVGVGLWGVSEGWSWGVWVLFFFFAILCLY